LWRRHFLQWFDDLGYEVRHGGEIAPGEPGAERGDYRQVLLEGRLRAAITRINPGAARAAIGEAIRVLKRTTSPSLAVENRTMHRLLVDGVTVETAGPDGGVRGHQIKLIDHGDPSANDWLVVNQFTVLDRSERRPDVLVFLNGIPVADVELKNPKDEDVNWLQAFKQHQTYKQEIPSLERYNAVMVASDGLADARIGSLTAAKEWFMPWRTIEGDDLAPPTANKLEVLVRGVFEKSRFLDLLRHFVVFEEEDGKLAKKIAGYHQFHATRKAVDTAVRAAAEDGDHRGGVWHTQGSGKSLTMAFFAGKLIAEPAMANPTVVVLTGRIDLDGQLFGVFSRCSALLRQRPEQAESRSETRELLDRASGGVIFTTVQKFLPEAKGDRFPTLSDRRNIVVIADEAHGPSTTSSTGTRATCATRSPARPSSGSPAHRSSSTTVILGPSSATTSTATTSAAPSRTVPPSRSTTRAVWRRSISYKTSVRASTRTSRRSPKAKRRPARSASRRSGLRLKRWSGPRSGCRLSPPISLPISRTGSRRWTERRWRLPWKPLRHRHRDGS